MQTAILIVEDHDGVRKSLHDWLAVEFPDHRILEAACGEDAIALARSGQLRLVVMDIGLPGMSGIEAVRQIKAISPSIQFVVVTIHEESSYRRDAIMAGASAYVPKRLMQTELIPTLTALLANPNGVGEGAEHSYFDRIE